MEEASMRMKKTVSEGRETPGTYDVNAASGLKGDINSNIRDFSSLRFVAYLEIHFPQMLNGLVTLVSFTCQYQNAKVF